MSDLLVIAEPRAETTAVGGRAAAWSDWWALTKPGINLMALITALVGYRLAGGGATDLSLLLGMLFGTGLAGAGANATNMWMERDCDGKMRRTANRPIPAGRIRPLPALVYGLAMAVLGPLVLALTTTPLAALVAAASVASYLLVYTPLKRVSSINTLVGAVPGALPPLIGWAAATGGLDGRAWGLFLILFFWQLPHFLGIAWRWRDDYARAGYRMLTVDDPEGDRTARQVILQSVALLAVSLLPTLSGLAGGLYFSGALVLGLGFLAFGLGFAARRTDLRAKRLFLASIVYLPCLLTILVIGRS